MVWVIEIVLETERSIKKTCEQCVQLARIEVRLASSLPHSSLLVDRGDCVKSIQQAFDNRKVGQKIVTRMQ